MVRTLVTHPALQTIADGLHIKCAILKQKCSQLFYIEKDFKITNEMFKNSRENWNYMQTANKICTLQIHPL